MPVEWNGDAVLAKVRAAAMRGVVRGTQDVCNTAIARLLDGKKSGRLYRRRGVVHRASAPGESPANDRSTLASNIRPRYDVAALTGYAVAGTKYARRLEEGGDSAAMNKHGAPKRGPVRVRILPRPYMKPALEENRDKIVANITEEIREALK